MHKKTSLPWLWLTLFILLLDQASKWYMVQQFDFGGSLGLLPFFGLYLDINTGAAFSLLGDSPEIAFWVFSSIAFAVAIILIVWMAKVPRQQRLLGVALALILGGALGNGIDRVRLGYVIDFFDLHWKNWHWPIFNVADIAICVGAALVVISMLRQPKSKKR